ncbi:MAG: alanine--tRNA ligase [Breznakia sp.]
MKYRSGNEIRQLFLDYFESKIHMVEPGASLVPHDDPTLLWINSGVAALKKYFDGSVKPQNKRIVNAQKSIRTNDIENVGKTARHHTFFEMLGNFSIGDYFKNEAIEFAWEFLTSPEYIGFEKEKMYITVHTEDQVAYKKWLSMGVSKSHLLKTKDNFWQHGSGPCGPNTELFYDRGVAYDPDKLGEKLFFEEIDNDRYIEVWNVVFSQFDGIEGQDRSTYKELPQKNIDTGMGLERLVSIVQNSETNFDTDLFVPIIKALETLSETTYLDYKMSYRVITDHIRTVVFALADGAVFSNSGRGYVLRRVLRRAVRHGLKIGLQDPFMYKLVSVVSENMKVFYPYLMDKIEYNQKLIKTEEEIFLKTLYNGERLLSEELALLKNTIFPGDIAFKLYDTYGFPYELTEEIVGESGCIVERKGFDEAMEKQRDRARTARSYVSSMASQSKDLMDFSEAFLFVGYQEIQCDAKIIGLFKDGKRVEKIHGYGDIIFDKSCFYAESGGQVSDQGSLQLGDAVIRVVDVKKAPRGQFLHHVEELDIELKENDQLHLRIDEKRRSEITRNHSATHLLQSAIKQVVGNHIGQAGSYVCDEYLRFDFTHFEKVSHQQLDEIERVVNTFIAEKKQVEVEYLNIEDAKKSGATAMFDEKYGDIVRVVSMGDASKEFCGGCHVTNTSTIGIFKILSEESIGSGVRRIVATSGMYAYAAFKEKERLLWVVNDVLQVRNTHDTIQKLNIIQKEMKELQKEVKHLQSANVDKEVDKLIQKAIVCDTHSIIIQDISKLEVGDMKAFALQLRDKVGSGVVFLYDVSKDKVVFVATATQDVVKQDIHCGDLVKQAAIICAGNGGGRADLAQAGGKDVQKVDDAIHEIALKLGVSL